MSTAEATATAAENRRAKTHCKYGHELSGYNLIVRSDGRRQCRTCSSNRTKDYRALKRPAPKPATQRFTCNTCGRKKYADDFTPYKKRNKTYIRGECKSCTSAKVGKRSRPHLEYHGRVPVEKILPLVNQIVKEIGLRPAARVLGVSYQAIWKWRTGRVTHIQKQKAATVLRNLQARA